MYKPALTAAIIFALLGVVIGAMGAHALEPALSSAPGMLSAYETAVQYQFYHSFALGLAGILYLRFSNTWICLAAWAFLAGIILFSGSLYLMAFLKIACGMSIGAVGILTPVGGVCFITGWICLLIGIYTKK
jgi:uncharacterized membrane protein YgdD (TMEM256/DUF423 family)